MSSLTSSSRSWSHISHDYITCSKFTPSLVCAEFSQIFGTFVLVSCRYSQFASSNWGLVVIFTTLKVLKQVWLSDLWDVIISKKSGAVTQTAEWFNLQTHSKTVFLIEKTVFLCSLSHWIFLPGVVLREWWLSVDSSWWSFVWCVKCYFQWPVGY